MSTNFPNPKDLGREPAFNPRTTKQKNKKSNKAGKVVRQDPTQYIITYGGLGTGKNRKSN